MEQHAEQHDHRSAPSRFVPEAIVRADSAAINSTFEMRPDAGADSCL
jgi:hypothetical protein